MCMGTCVYIYIITDKIFDSFDILCILIYYFYQLIYICVSNNDKRYVCNVH